MSAFDDNFAYALVSSNNRTLKITGVNPTKYNLTNANWGSFPAVPAIYTGPTLAYNGYGTEYESPTNAFTVVEISDNAFAGLTRFAEGPLVLPSTLLRIGDNAFNSVKISGRLTIPASVTYIGTQAFANTLIDELVVENETNSDVLSGIMDLTGVAAKNSEERNKTDGFLNTLKVPKANPTFTGLTTIQNAITSIATVANTTIINANISSETADSATIDYYESNISDTLRNSRFQVLTTSGNLLVNESNGIEIVLSAGVYRSGVTLVSEIISKLNAKSITWVGGSPIIWGNSSFDPNTNSVKLGYSTDAPTSITSVNANPTIAIRTKFMSNGVAYDSSKILGAAGAMVGSSYEDGAFLLTYGNRNGLSFPQAIDLNTPTLTVYSAATLDGTVGVSGQWNFLTNKPKYNAQVLATESYTRSKMQIIDVNKLTSTIATLSTMISVFKQDPDFELHAPQSQAALLQSITSITGVRSTDVSSLSTALSTQLSQLQSVDSSISVGISSAIPVRSSQINSISTSLQSAVSSLQSVDLSISSALTTCTSNRGSQTRSLNSEISTAASLLRNADLSISTAISTEIGTRSLNISTNSSALSAQGSALQSVDVVLSAAITDDTTARSNAVSSISTLISTTVPSLESVDSAFSTGLTQQTTNRVASVASLSGAMSTQVSATQSMNAVILPKISGSASVVPDATTSTVFNLIGVSVGDSLTFVKSGGSGTFSNGDKITITYSATDYLKGTVSSVAGSNITFTVNEKVTSASETTIYTTTGPSGTSTADSSGSKTVALSSPAFVAGSNYVITSMTGTMFSSTNTGTYRVSLLDASNAVIATSLVDEPYNSVQTLKTHTFNTALIIKNGANIKQKFTFLSGNSTQIIVNYTDMGAYTVMKGYAVPYSSGTVQLNTNGALQNTRISAIGALSAGISTTMVSLQGKLTGNQTDFSSNANARTASINSIISATTSSMGSTQTVVSTLGSTLASAVAQRSTNASSLSAMITTNMTALSSTATSISSALSTQISNRSTQVLNGITTLVGAAPSSLDTLFEIGTALDAGPQLYATVTATEASLTSNVTARNSGVLSVSTSLSTAASTLQTTDSTLSSGISSATVARVASAASMSTAISTFISTAQSNDTSISTGISNTVSARLFGVSSISSALSSMAVALQTTDSTVISTGISTAVSARQSGVASASTVLSSTVFGLQSVNNALSSGISTGVSARQSGVGSLSNSLSGVVSAQQSSVATLSAAFSTLNAGINLTTLANTTAVDSAINQVVGVGAVSALDTLNEIAGALNNNATLVSTLDTLVNSKGATSVVLSLSDAASLKVNQTDLTQLVSTVGTKANNTLVSQLQSALTTMGSTIYGTISNEVQSLQSNMTVNTSVTGQLSDTIRQLDSLYTYNGLTNADGSVKYNINALANMVLQSSSLAFTIDAGYAVTKVTQVAIMKFDATQTNVKYTSRGVEYTLNPIALTSGLYTFNIDSSSATDYTNNATQIVVTAFPTTLRTAPANSPFTISKLALPIYATPTVQTPYDATTWSDVTGKISQVLRINFESGVQRLQIDGTVYDVSGTTQKVHTLEYLPSASGTLNIKALNSTTKLESAVLSLSNVYNDYPQHAVPAEVGGSKSVTVSGSTYTYAATYTTTASAVELQTYNIGTSSYSSSDLAVVGGQVSVSLNYAVDQIGQPLFKLRAKTSNSKRISDFTSVANGEAITFSQPVQTNVSYTTLSAGSYRVTATYSVHPLASAVKVSNPSTTATYIASQAASGGTVSFSVDYTQTQVTNGTISFIVTTIANSYGLQSVASAAFVPIGQYDAPVYVNDGSKVVTLSGSTYTYSAKYTSASSAGINVYDHTGAFIKTVTGTSPFTITQTYASSRIGLVAFKLSSKDIATSRESALIDVTGEDIPTYAAPTISVSISYLGTGPSYTANMSYTVSSGVTAVEVRKASDSTVVSGVTSSVIGTTATISVPFTDAVSPLNIVVVALANIYGKASAASATQTLIKQYAAPVLSGSINYDVVSANSYTAGMSYTVASNVTAVEVRKVSDGTVISGATSSISVTTATITVPFTAAVAPLGIVVVALANSMGRESAASSAQTLVGQYITPVLSGSVAYSGTIATATYTLASTVSTVSVYKKATGPTVTGIASQWAVTGTGASQSGLGYASYAVNYPSGIHDSVYRLRFSNGVVSSMTLYTDVLNSYKTWGFTNPDVVFALSNVPPNVTAILQIKNHAVAGDVWYDVTGVASQAITSSTTTIKFSGETGLYNSTPPVLTNYTVVLSSVSVTTPGTVALSIPYTSADVSDGKSFYVVANSDTNGFQSGASVLQPLLNLYAAPVLSGSISYTGTGPSYAANMSYTVTSGVTAVSVLKSDLTALPAGASVTTNSVLGTTATIQVTFTDGLSPLAIVVVAQGNSNGATSAASTAQTLLRQFAAPVLSGSIIYGTSGSNYTAQMNYTVSSDVSSVKMTDFISSATVLDTAPATMTTYNDISYTGMIYRMVLTGSSSGAIAGDGSYSSDSTLAKAAVHSGILAIGETKTVHVQMVTGVNVFISSTKNGITSGGFNNSSQSYRAYTFIPTTINIAQSIVSTTGASRIISLTATYATSIMINVFALGNSMGRESAASTTQPLLKQFAAPVLSGGVIYGTSGSNTTAQFSYTVASGVTAVSVLKPDLTALTGGASFTNSVLGTTATIQVSFTGATLDIVVVAQGNSDFRQSDASTAQTLMGKYAAPVLSGSIAYSGSDPSTATMSYTVDSGVNAVSVLKSSDLSAIKQNYYISNPLFNETLTGFPTVGKTKTWTFIITEATGSMTLRSTLDNNVSALYLEFRSDRLILNRYNYAWGSEAVSLSGFHNLARPTTFTITYDGNYFTLANSVNATKFSYYGYDGLTVDQITDAPVINTTAAITYTGPVVVPKTSWYMRIPFKVTSGAGTWRALIGNMRNSVIYGNGRGWGLWISSANNLYFSWSSPTWDSGLSVALNKDYVVELTSTASSLTIVLTDVVANTTQTAVNTSTSSYIMGANGLVTVGGWALDFNENFPGTISSVYMVPDTTVAGYYATVSGTTASIKILYPNTVVPLGFVVVAKENILKQSEASVVQTLLGGYATPSLVTNSKQVLLSGATYTVSAKIDLETSTSYSILNASNTPVSAEVSWPTAFVLRKIGTTTWKPLMRQQNPDRSAQSSALSDYSGANQTYQAWNTDGQFDGSFFVNPDNEITWQFSYFASYWLNRLQIPIGEYISVPVYTGRNYSVSTTYYNVADVLNGYFTFGMENSTTMVGRLSSYNSGTKSTFTIQSDAVTTANDENAADTGTLRISNGLPDLMVIRQANTWIDKVSLIPASLASGQTWGNVNGGYDTQFYDTNAGPQNQVALQFAYFAQYWLTRLRVPVNKVMSIPVLAAQGSVGIFSFFYNGTAYRGSLNTYNSGTVYDLATQANAITAGTTDRAKYMLLATYTSSSIGQTVLKIGNAATAAYRASDYLVINGEDIPTFAAPVLSGSITYGVNGSNYTAQMNYTVNSNVSTMSMSYSATAVPGAIVLATAPTSMSSYTSSNINSIYQMDITGAPVTNSTIWGTGTYTADSNLARSAVHAGVVAVNETKTVYVKILAGLSSYTASTQNGYASNSFGSYSLSYQFILPTVSISQFIVSTTGASRVISATITYSDSIIFNVKADGNSKGKQSAASATQTLLKAYATPVLSSSIGYSGSGPFIASMSYTVGSNVTAVNVLKSDLSALPAGASFTNSVTGTTATIQVTFTDANSPLAIVVVAAGDAYGRASAASDTQTLLKQYIAPVLSGTPNYTTVSAGSYTADMTYTVASGVTNVSVIKSSDTAYYATPMTMGQTLTNFPTIGAKKTWTFTITSALGGFSLTKASDTSKVPFYIDFRSDRVVLSQYATGWGPEQHIMSGLHNLARPTTFTVSFDSACFLLSYNNNTQTTAYPNHQSITSIDDITNVANTNGTASYTGPVTTKLSRWEMNIKFRTTGRDSLWRGLVGDMRNSVVGTSGRGWGLWISSANNIYFSGSNTSYFAVSPAFTVAQNTDYILAITKTSSQMLFSLTNLSTTTTQTATHNVSIQMSANGPVTAGGWISDSTENFVGTISYVNVIPSIASAAVSGNTAIVTVPYVTADSPLNIVAIAQVNSNGRQSDASTTQTLQTPFAAPVLASSAYSGTNTYTATMSYTVDSGVTEVSVLKSSDLSAINKAYAVSNPTFNQSLDGFPIVCRKKIWTFTVSTGNAWYFSLIVNGDRNNYTNPLVISFNGVNLVKVRRKFSANDADQYFYSEVYDLPKPTIFTVTLDGNFFIITNNRSSLMISLANNENFTFDQLSVDGPYTNNISYTAPVTTEATSWCMRIPFKVTSGAGTWRALIGNMRNSVIGSTGTGWGLRISDTNTLHFSWSSPTWDSGLSIALNKDYLVELMGTASSLTIVLTDVAANTTQTAVNNSTSSYIMGNGMVTVGGWPLDATENFPGTISSVYMADIAVARYYATVSGTTASIVLSYRDALLPLGIVVVAQGNKPTSAASAVNTLTGRYAAPVLSGSIGYSGSDPFIASMSYTVTSGVTAVSVLKSDLTALPAGASATSSVTGTTATISITFTNAVAPLSFVVIAQGNSNILQSAASTTQTLSGIYSAPVLSGSVAFSATGGTSVATATYTVASTVSKVSVYKKASVPVVTGAASQFVVVGTGASNSNLWYSSYSSNYPSGIHNPTYRLRFSNGLISSLTINPRTNDYAIGFTNPDVLFAVSNVPSSGVTAILQIKDNAAPVDTWYDVSGVASQAITSSTTTIKFSGDTCLYNSTQPILADPVILSSVSVTTPGSVTLSIPYTMADISIANSYSFYVVADTDTNGRQSAASTTQTFVSPIDMSPLTTLSKTRLSAPFNLNDVIVNGSSSGYTYSSSNTSIVSINNNNNGTIATVAGTGTVTITSSGGGSANLTISEMTIPSAYLYEKSAAAILPSPTNLRRTYGTVSANAQLNCLDTYGSSSFGYTMQMATNGKWLIVGNPHDDNGTGVTSANYGRASIYQYNGSVFTLYAYSTGGSQNACHGMSVAISGNGKVYAVLESTYNNYYGVIKVFKKNANYAYYDQTGTINGIVLGYNFVKIHPSYSSISLSGAGTHLVAGLLFTVSQGSSSTNGAVSTYNIVTPTLLNGNVRYSNDPGGTYWSYGDPIYVTEVNDILGTSSEQLGINVKISSDALTLMASNNQTTPTIYTYRRTYTQGVYGQWTAHRSFTQEIMGSIYTSMSMSDDGNRLAVSKAITGGVAQVLVYNINNGGVDFSSSKQANQNWYGSSLSLSGDSNVLAITEWPDLGSSNSRTYLFDVNTWQQIGTPNVSSYSRNFLGNGVSLSVDGTVIARSFAESNGSVSVFIMPITRGVYYSTTASWITTASQLTTGYSTPFIEYTAGNTSTAGDSTQSYSIVTYGQDGASVTTNAMINYFK